MHSQVKTQMGYWFVVIINQGDMSKEYLDLKFIYHYDESLPNKIPLKIIAPNHLLETNLQASKEWNMILLS